MRYPAAQPARKFDYLLQVGHAGHHGVQVEGLGPGARGYVARQRRLAGAGRAVKDGGFERVGLYGAAQQLAFAQDLLLAGEIGEFFGREPGRQRGIERPALRAGGSSCFFKKGV